jgi:hypothetical protein
MSPEVTTFESTQRRLWAERDFSLAQELLAGEIAERVTSSWTCSWYDVGLRPERGAFAVVGRRMARPDLVGRTLYVQHGPRPGVSSRPGTPVAHRGVFVYCIAEASLVSDIAIARRAWMVLALHVVDDLTSMVHVVA